MARVYDSVEKQDATGCFQFLTPNSRVLEFGPATGYWTCFMKERMNCRVTCVELIPEVAERASVYAEKMIVADIDRDDWDKEIDGTFDYIVFGDVLEHLRNPKLAVEKAKKFLNPTGFILTSVPNIGHNSILLNLRNGNFKYLEMGLLDNTHIHFFTRKSLFEMFESQGVFCVNEKNIILSPCRTEFKVYYFKNPILTLSILRRRDGHVYQFVNKWGMGSVSETPREWKGVRLSLIRYVEELFFDFLCFVFDKMPKGRKDKIKSFIKNNTLIR